MGDIVNLDLEVISGPDMIAYRIFSFISHTYLVERDSGLPIQVVWVECTAFTNMKTGK